MDDVFKELAEARVDDAADPIETLGWNRYDWRKPSLAVVVSNGDRIAVPWTAGVHVRFDLVEHGLGFEDLGLDDAPDGISIWEGVTKGGQYIGDGEYSDPYLDGTFRQPTDEEWAAIRAGRSPWNDDEWLVPEARLALEAP